jgi:hypothetical protein
MARSRPEERIVNAATLAAFFTPVDDLQHAHYETRSSVLAFPRVSCLTHPRWQVSIILSVSYALALSLPSSSALEEREDAKS